METKCATAQTDTDTIKDKKECVAGKFCNAFLFQYRTADKNERRKL